MFSTGGGESLAELCKVPFLGKSYVVSYCMRAGQYSLE